MTNNGCTILCCAFLLMATVAGACTMTVCSACANWSADDTPTWELAADNRACSDELVASIKTVADGLSIEPGYLLAIGHVESRNNHYDADGNVQRGDNGRAIGWGQVHRCPWQNWASEQIGLPVNLDDLLDNVTVCGMILLRGGYDIDDDTTWEPAAAYYNTGKHLNSTSYSRAVMKQLAMIKDGE